MERDVFDIWKKRIKENRCMKKLFIDSEHLNELVFLSIAASFPFLEHIDITYHTLESSPDNDFYSSDEEESSNYIVMSMFGLPLKKLVLHTASGFMNQSKIFFKLITDNSRPSYFSLVLLPGPSEISHLPASHHLVENTQQEYEDSIENYDYFTFYIICKSLEEIDGVPCGY
jgi:hypothetical protein